MQIDIIAVPDFFVGQGTAAPTPAPIVAPGHAPKRLFRGVTIRAAKNNTVAIRIGHTQTGNFFPLAPGDDLTIRVDDIHRVFVSADSSSDFAWVAE